MKKTFVKNKIDDLTKAVEQRFGKKCEIMTLQVETMIDKEGKLFAHMEAVVDLEGAGQSYKVEKDYDL